ncbi:hypothetical protein D3C86_1566290 [compost metagenome]
MPLNDGHPCPELYTLSKDQLQPASTRGIYLAESFAHQEGWLVKEERIRWKDWLRQQGLSQPQRPRSGLHSFTGKARQLLQLARGGLNK